MIGQPRNWQFGFQQAASVVMQKISHFHDVLLCIIFCLGFLVMCLLFYICWRFRAAKNPIPSQFNDNWKLEIIWTLIPLCVVICIGIQSVNLIYVIDKIEKPDLTIKIKGKQWYWSYEYPEYNIAFDSFLKNDNPRLRLLEVDQPLVIPCNKNIRILVTSEDVIHSWGVPSLGVKRDGLPGRLQEATFKALSCGTLYGQCYELCGPRHAFMPIEVRVVQEDDFKKWVTSLEKH